MTTQIKRTTVYGKMMAGCRKGISSRGINLGIDDLIRLSGVSKMGMYQNFARRELLIEAVLREITDDALKFMQAQVDLPGNKLPAKRLLAAALCLCKMAAGGTDSNYEVLSLVQAGLPETVDRTHVDANAAKSRVSEFLYPLVREVVGSSSADQVVEEIMIITDGVTMRGLHHNQQEAELSGKTMLERLIKGLKSVK